jgi:hypothetical protein
MAISPFSARPASPEGEGRRARVVVAIAVVGIAATLMAYAISPGVRHAVGHAAHSVKGAVSHVLDRDQAKRARAGHPSVPAPKHAGQPAPAQPAARPSDGSRPPVAPAG